MDRILDTGGGGGSKQLLVITDIQECTKATVIHAALQSF